MTPLPRRGKRKAASQNVKTAIPTTGQSENEKNPKLGATIVRRTRRKTGRRNERSGPSQSRKNQKAESNPRTNRPPLRPTPAQNQIDPPGASGPKALPSQDRDPPNDHHPPRRSRNTITRVSVPLTYTGRSDKNVRSWGGPRRLARPVRVLSSVTIGDPSTRRIVCILRNG